MPDPRDIVSDAHDKRLSESLGDWWRRTCGLPLTPPVTYDVPLSVYGDTPAPPASERREPPGIDVEKLIESVMRRVLVEMLPSLLPTLLPAIRKALLPGLLEDLAMAMRETKRTQQ